MSRLSAAFGRAQDENRAALIIYLCAGDPDLQTTLPLLEATAAAGADIIEIGVPFSDPTADGPVIQRASERSLAGGTTLESVLDVTARFRSKSEVATVLFGYYNPILAMGEARAVARAADAGVDGFLVVDLPPEESGPLASHLERYKLDFVPLVAPTTSLSRVDTIASVAGSFIYYVSLTGVTGAAADLEAAAGRAQEVKQRTSLPVAVGFGVKTPQHVRDLALRADGVVVGSAVCLAIEQADNADSAISAVSQLVTSLRAACAR